MNVLLVDERAVVRLGWSQVLAPLYPDLLASEAASGEDAVTLAQHQVPDLVILDIVLPGISGVETARRLLQRWPLLRILFFSAHDELPLVRQALAAGAMGYLTQRAGREVMADAVRRVLAGHRYIEQDLATRLACAGSDDTALHPRLQGMTQREFEIFVMLSRGVPPKRIADNLCLSGKTVANNLTVLKQKLQVSTLTELVHLAIDTGINRSTVA